MSDHSSIFGTQWIKQIRRVICTCDPLMLSALCISFGSLDYSYKRLAQIKRRLIEYSDSHILLSPLHMKFSPSLSIKSLFNVVFIDSNEKHDATTEGDADYLQEEM